MDTVTDVNSLVARKEAFLGQVRELLMPKIQRRRAQVQAVPLRWCPGFINGEEAALYASKCTSANPLDVMGLTLGMTRYDIWGKLKDIRVAGIIDCGPLCLGAILTHELAHAVVGMNTFMPEHGVVWQYECSRLGLIPDITVDPRKITAKNFTDMGLVNKILALEYPT